MKNRVQTAIRVWDFAENSSDQAEVIKPTRPLFAMEISEASSELLSTDKLLHVFQVPIVRKTLKCVVYKINGLTQADGGGLCNSASPLPGPTSGPTPPFDADPWRLPYKDLLESVCSVQYSANIP